MTNISALALIVSIVSLIVALRTAMLNYRLRADDVRRDIGTRVASGLDRAERARLLLEYVNQSSADDPSATRLDLPSLVDAESRLRAFATRHAARPDSEVIGMRNTDLEDLRAIQDPLLKVEQRLDVLRIMLRHGDAKGTA